MKVKLLVSRVGVDFSQSKDEEITVSDAEGKRMIAAGQAEAVGAVPRSAPVQRAVADLSGVENTSE